MERFEDARGHVARYRSADRVLDAHFSARAERAVTLKGRLHLADDVREDVRQWVERNAPILADGLPPRLDRKHPFEYLLLRYEEMLQRTRLAGETGESLDAVRKLLCFRYAALLETFAVENTQGQNLLASSFLYNGPRLIDIPRENEFAWCEDQPWIIQHAVTGHPMDPRAYLRKVRATMDGVLRDPAYEWCHEQIGLVRRAAVKNPEHAKSFLDDVRCNAEEILREEEFASFDRTAVYGVCALVKTPRDRLRAMKTDIASLDADPDLAWCANASLKTYAAANSTDPKRWLLDFRARRDEIKGHPDCAWIKDNPSIVEQLAKIHPASWLSRVRDAHAQYRGILEDRSFAWCVSVEGNVRDLVFKTPDYATRLRAAAEVARAEFECADLNAFFGRTDGASEKKMYVLKTLAYQVVPGM